MPGSGVNGQRVLVTGSAGLIGRHLLRQRAGMGDTVVPLLRSGSPAGLEGTGDAGSTASTVVHLAPDGSLEPAMLAGFDVVVHLAGEPVAGGRWTPARKQRIRDSRVLGTQRLAAALGASGAPPRVFLCASGINIYGDQGSRVLDEAEPAGNGFLADVCVAWEQAAEVLASSTRVVHLRLGAVLTPEGGALASMLPLVRAGLAGPIAGGKQYISWIALEDTLRAIHHLIDGSALAGPVNLVSPNPITSRRFTEAIASAARRPAWLPVPAWAARLAMGQMADETVLASVRAVPRRLLEDGFAFGDADLQPSLERMLASR